MNTTRCPICFAPANSTVNVKNFVHSFECKRCGAFRCDHYAIITLRRMEWSAQQIGAVSGYVRHNPGIFIQGQDVEQLTSRPTPSVGEKAARLLLALAQEHPQPGESFWAPVWKAQSAVGMLEKYGKNDELPEEVLSDPKMEELRWLA